MAEPRLGAPGWYLGNGRDVAASRLSGYDLGYENRGKA